MKDLFAKYIVVEGDIKVGDIVLEELNGGNWELFEIHTLEDIDNEKQRKCKLHLCTLNVDWTKIHTRETHVPFVQKNGEPSIFQVLVQIPDSAKWVREGDEFDEDQIEFRIYDKGTGFQAPMKMKNWIDEDNPIYLKTIKILGPCGHYH